MKVIDSRKVENCFDGSVIYEYRFSEPITENAMTLVAGAGRLTYFPQFSRPFFKIDTGEGIQVKGIVGDQTIQVVFPRRGKWELRKEFESLLEGLFSTPQQ